MTDVEKGLIRDERIKRLTRNRNGNLSELSLIENCSSRQPAQTQSSVNEKDTSSNHNPQPRQLSQTKLNTSRLREGSRDKMSRSVVEMPNMMHTHTDINYIQAPRIAVALSGTMYTSRIIFTNSVMFSAQNRPRQRIDLTKRKPEKSKSNKECLVGCAMICLFLVSVSILGMIVSVSSQYKDDQLVPGWEHTEVLDLEDFTTNASSITILEALSASSSAESFHHPRPHKASGVTSPSDSPPTTAKKEEAQKFPGPIGPNINFLIQNGR